MSPYTTFTVELDAGSGSESQLTGISSNEHTTDSESLIILMTNRWRKA